MLNPHSSAIAIIEIISLSTEFTAVLSLTPKSTTLTTA